MSRTEYARTYLYQKWLLFQLEEWSLQESPLYSEDLYKDIVNKDWPEALAKVNQMVAQHQNDVNYTAIMVVFRDMISEIA